MSRVSFQNQEGWIKSEEERGRVDSGLTGLVEHSRVDIVESRVHKGRVSSGFERFVGYLNE
jgi:hypothetical protein